MPSRKEYFQKYYQDHKADIIKRSKEDYEQNKRKRLTYQAKYYILHREEILAKLKTKSLAFTGHAHAIWNAIRKYAKEWKLPITPWDEFKLWTIDDGNYNSLFETWKESGYDNNLSPVVMRGVKKNGFVIENLKWDKKQSYSWWGEDAKIFKEEEEKLNQQQIDRNKRDKEWRKKIREEWKAKRKGK